ncbi:MAG: hypothetical protein H7249_00325 [Chitinophagaceae bacterium]|nr:hypothetical protein [Oligoflexus sp.]
MKFKTLALFTTLIAPLSADLYAQVSGSASASPSTGATVNSGVIPSQGATDGTGVTTMQSDSAAMGTSVNNAQAAQGNAVQANPGQTQQQATGGGVFGPSSGPGIFGPAAGSVTNDSFGSQQPASGSAIQPNQPTPKSQGTLNRGVRSPGQGAGPTVYDASGNPSPANNLYQGALPRDLNPITPSGAQPSQTQPTSSVTGR